MDTRLAPRNSHSARAVSSARCRHGLAKWPSSVILVAVSAVLALLFSFSCLALAAPAASSSIDPSPQPTIPSTTLQSLPTRAPIFDKDKPSAGHDTAAATWGMAKRQVLATTTSSPFFNFPPTPTPTPRDEAPGGGMNAGTRAIGLTLLALFLFVIFCTFRFSMSATMADDVHPSARAHDGDVPDTSAPHATPSVAFGNPLATPVYRYTFTSRGAQTFLRDYPAEWFPIDAAALHAMQDSPAHWHFLDPGRVLPEFRLLLSPLVRCDADTQRVSLFADGHPGAPVRAESRTRPRALCVQTRLPAPVPPEDARDIDSPYAGFRVPGIVYFEVRFTDVGPPARAATSTSSSRAPLQLSVGLAFGPYPPFRLPGWTKWSMGYLSDTGHLHVGSSSSGQAYGPAFGKGDVVGVGIVTDTRCVFYTLNGKRLHMAVELPAGKEAVFPTVGATGPCTFEYNFGSAGEFVWDGRMFQDEAAPMVDEDGWQVYRDPADPAPPPPPPPPARAHRSNEFVGYVMDSLPAYEE